MVKVSFEMYFRPINAKNEQNFIGLSYTEYRAGRKGANYNYYNKTYLYRQ